ncbi:hypothetical protein [Shouchella miscanthi]|uniref:Uncharacterized protein n=1 Tax=Shouchella miscanthi TaxID=2598861 RepID=A0ABU6NNC0_9BACI|nr:hypothetical protein [Shouchella miscanthi]MED4129681.1 hypothetical protein [Shouchella miscanthi]
MNRENKIVTLIAAKTEEQWKRQGVYDVFERYEQWGHSDRSGDLYTFFMNKK